MGRWSRRVGGLPTNLCWFLHCWVPQRKFKNETQEIQKAHVLKHSSTSGSGAPQTGSVCVCVWFNLWSRPALFDGEGGPCPVLSNSYSTSGGAAASPGPSGSSATVPASAAVGGAPARASAAAAREARPPSGSDAGASRSGLASAAAQSQCQGAGLG